MSLSPQRTTSNLDLEPNPFEQSFSSRKSPPSILHPSPTPDNNNSDSLPNSNSNGNNNNNGNTNPNGNSNTTQEESATPKPTLPPLASLASPSDPSSGFPWFATGSLRSGPLSPAMLAGPQQQPNSSSLSGAVNGSSSVNVSSHLPFDPSFIRTGLTPDVNRTGLTPLVGGPVSFPPPSPNTQALFNMVTNSTTAAALANSTPATITPNTLAHITGAYPPSTTQNSSSSTQPHPLSISHVPTSGYSRSNAPQTPNTTNGLFLLSQAHQELTKREQEAAAAAQAQQKNGGGGGSRISTRASTSGGGVGASTNAAAKRKLPTTITTSPEPTKRTRGAANANGRKSSANRRKDSEDLDMSDFDEDESMDGNRGGMHQSVSPTNGNKGAGGGMKKPETEEEKRKNFLERNRQAALKCRQRKKAWLSQLQAKVEYLAVENERLQNVIVGMREEVGRLEAVLGSRGISAAGAVAAGAGANGGGVAAGGGGGRKEGRGYGY